MEEKKKKSIFSFGSFNKKDLVLFIYSPISLFVNINFLWYTNIKNSTYRFESIKYFFIYFGYIIINGILYLFHYKNYENKNKTQEIEIFFKVDDKKSFQNKDKKEIIIIFTMIIILDNLSSYTLNHLRRYSNFIYSFCYMYHFQILFFWIISKLFLKFQIEKHHYCSSFIIILGLFLIHLINFLTDEILHNVKYIVIFISFFYHILYTFTYFFGYYILYEKAINLNKFLLILGFMGILIGLFFSLINHFTSFKYFKIDFFEGINDIFQKNTFSKICGVLILSLIDGITYTFLWLIFTLFKPWFYGVSVAVFGFLISIFRFVPEEGYQNINFFRIIFEITIYVLLIFSCLIFNEQIICNLCDLNKGTKNAITERSKRELRLISYNSEISV